MTATGDDGDEIQYDDVIEVYTKAKNAKDDDGNDDDEMSCGENDVAFHSHGDSLDFVTLAPPTIPSRRGDRISSPRFSPLQPRPWNCPGASSAGIT